MWLLAIKAMLADRGKLVTTVLGITFSVVLVNLQGGLFLGLMQKSTLLIDYGQADVWVGHRHMNNVDLTTSIPERWIDRVRKLDGVERADPYLVGAGYMNLPNGGQEQVFIVGAEPASLLGNPVAMAEGRPEDVRKPDGILIDAYEADERRAGPAATGRGAFGVPRPVAVPTARSLADCPGKLWT